MTRLTVHKGTSPPDVVLVITDSSVAVDLTGASATAYIRATRGGAIVATYDVTIPGDATNELRLHLSAAESALLTPTGRYWAGCVVTFPSGVKRTVLDAVVIVTEATGL